MSDVPPPSGPTTTLDKVDIVSFDVPALPTAAITAVGGAGTIITAVTAPTRTLRTSSSLPFFHAPHDDDALDEDEHLWSLLDPQDKGKAKEKATPSPAPTPSTSRPPQHPLLVEAGYTTNVKEVKRWAAPEHQSTRDNLEALSIGLCLLDSRVNVANANIAEGLDGLRAQIVGLTSDIATLPQGSGAGHGLDPAVYNSLVAASNAHNDNFKRIVLRIQELVADQAALRSSVNTSIAAFTTSIDALTSRIPQIVSQPSSNNDSLRSMLEDVINENGKRARTNDDATNLGRAAPAPPIVYAQLQPPVSMQAQFAPQPLPAQPLYAPQPTSQVQQAPVVQQPQPMSYAPQQQVYGPPAPQQQYQPAPQPQYQPQAVVPPQAVVDPRREVALMPHAWPIPKSARDWILDVMTRDVMRNARFTVRRGRDSQEIIMTFEAENMAAWFIGAWNGSNRRNVKGLQNVYASLNV
ncbi:hypothetical protein C8F01DRAFT_1098516 [Mycena amicta]|nr:hypothetical protein C8F01DRAFT_1098516 [Mycena amicta]